MAYFTAHDVKLDQFYQIPKELIKGKRYKKLSSKAVLAYGILRDRHSLSLKNEWMDQQGRIYFILSDKELAEVLEVTVRTANKIKNDLVDHDLLAMVRQGKKKANILYLKKPESDKTETVDNENKNGYDLQKDKPEQGDMKKTSHHVSGDRKKSSHQVTGRKVHVHYSKTYSSLSKTENNSSNTDLSIKDEKNDQDIPAQIQVTLKQNQDRLTDHGLTFNDIQTHFYSVSDQVDQYRYNRVLKRVLAATKEKIKDFERLMDYALKNDADSFQTKQDHNDSTISGEKQKRVIKGVEPDWLHDERKRQDDQEDPDDLERARKENEERLKRLRSRSKRQEGERVVI